MTAHFSTQMLKSRKLRNNIFKLLKENNCQFIIPYTARKSFGNKGQVKVFLEKTKVHENNSPLQSDKNDHKEKYEMQKGIKNTEKYNTSINIM